MPKVSIIMPSLNVVQYIRECMDSVVSQTLQDIEILCVDAGSTDGTLEILQKYAAKDSRIRIIGSNRRSYGFQVNLGIDIATGEYLGIVETDDYIDPTMFQKLYDTAIENKADFVKSSYYLFADIPQVGRLKLEHNISGLSYMGRDRKYISSEDYTNQTISLDSYIWNGIYKRDFVKTQNIRLNETPGAAYQDAGFRFQVAFLAERGIIVPDAFYHYRRDNAGSSMYSPKGLQYDLQECQYIFNWMADRFPGDMARMRAISCYITVIFLYSIQKSALIDNPDKQTLVENFRKLLRICYDSGYLVQEDFSTENWLDLKMFLENPLLFDSYVKFKAETELKLLCDFLSLMRTKKEIIIYGCGTVGNRACFLLHRNNISNIVSFCDSDSKKWGSKCMGKEILSPQEAVLTYPNAFFLIANRSSYKEIISVLINLNVPRDNIGIYRLSSDLLVCTSKYI